MQRIRTPWREIRDVDLGPKPANLFAPMKGANPYGELRGSIVVGRSGSDADFTKRREARP